MASANKDPPKDEWHLIGGGFKHLLFLTLPGEMIKFDEHVFQMGGSTTN